jgi:hypothetical protein
MFLSVYAYIPCSLSYSLKPFILLAFRSGCFISQEIAVIYKKSTIIYFTHNRTKLLVSAYYYTWIEADISKSSHHRSSSSRLSLSIPSSLCPPTATGTLDTIIWIRSLVRNQVGLILVSPVRKLFFPVMKKEHHLKAREIENGNNELY